MKNYLFGSISLVLAFTASSFINFKAKKKTTIQSTFTYIGTIYDDSHYDDPYNWRLDIGGLFCDGGGDRLCSIDASVSLYNPFIPDFSELGWWDHVRTTSNSAIVSNRCYKE
jgi:hypothetical protein